jgi:hypothetical protein
MLNHRITELLQQDVFFSDKNIDDDELLETKIYRYFRINDLIETLTTKKLKLKKPHLWNDPFENLFLKSAMKDIHGNEIDLGVTKEQIFAQCWTLKEESGLMWSSYVHDKKGAKATSTIGSLLKIIPEHNIAFIKAVSYWSEKEIFEYFANPLTFNVNETPLFKTLFIKRKEFEEEQEVRLVFHDMFRNCDPKSNIHIANFNRNEYKSDFAFLPIEPDLLFSEIILNPHLNEEKVEHYKNKIGKWFNGNISKSKLYRVPNVTLIIDNTLVEPNVNKPLHG